MDLIKLGATGLDINPLIFGTLPLGPLPVPSAWQRKPMPMMGLRRAGMWREHFAN